jgi:hypothetical protein
VVPVVVLPVVVVDTGLLLVVEDLVLVTRVVVGAAPPG